MKKITFSLCAALALCGAADARDLVAYYSRSGNTEIVAKKIAEITGADLYKIETADANHYPADYTETTVVAKQEITDGTLPAINAAPDLSQYDTIYVGTPCWWGTMASPVRTFLTNNNFDGKTIAPFDTHGGSGAGNVFTDIEKLTPNATHRDGVAIYGTAASSSDDTLKAWLGKTDTGGAQ